MHWTTLYYPNTWNPRWVQWHHTAAAAVAYRARMRARGWAAMPGKPVPYHL